MPRPKGLKHSEETKEKMRNSHLGEKNHFYGKTHTDESLQKMRESHKGCISWNKGLRLTEEHKNNLKGKRPSASGENNHNWVEDRTQIIGRHNRVFHDPEYKRFVREIRTRDGHQCKINNADCKGRLEVHHILGWKDHPELRYDINNGISLCHFHHPRTRSEENKLSPYFQELVKKEGAS